VEVYRRDAEKTERFGTLRELRVSALQILTLKENKYGKKNQRQPLEVENPSRNIGL
jgi:hypothetical protein